MTFEEAIQEVKRRTDIGNVIGRTTKLKRAGRNLSGLCPFHQEKTPSFYVHPQDGYFKCFGCDAKGDVFSFLERTTGQTFFEVLKGLADECGVTLPEDKLSPADQERRKKNARLKHVLSLAQHYFRQNLKHPRDGRTARTYLSDSRGLNEEMADTWGIGFAGFSGDGLQQFLEGQSVSKEEAQNAGVVAEGQNGFYDFYRGRITIPIRNRQGEIIAFGGRQFLEQDQGRPKYVNGPLTSVYDKSKSFFGLYEALPAIRQGKPAVLVEGYFDVIASHRADYPAGVSICGTSLTEQHVRILKKSTDRVVLCLDSDTAGQQATERAILQFLVGGFDVSLCALIGKDPDAVVQAGEKETLKRDLTTAPAALDVLTARAVEAAAGSVRARLNAISKLIMFLAAPQSEFERRQYTKAAALALGEDETHLWGEVETRGKASLEKAMRGRIQRLDGRSETPRSGNAPSNRENKNRNAPGTSGQGRQGAPEVSRWTASERSIARALCAHPILAPRCGVLVEAFKNAELREFVQVLTDLLVRHHDLAPTDVLLKVPIRRGSVLAEIFVDLLGPGAHTQNEPFLAETDARQLIEDFVLRMDRFTLETKLGELQKQISVASAQADATETKKLMEIQRDTVQMLQRHGFQAPDEGALQIEQSKADESEGHLRLVGSEGGTGQQAAVLNVAGPSSKLKSRALASNSAMNEESSVQERPAGQATYADEERDLDSSMLPEDDDFLW